MMTTIKCSGVATKLKTARYVPTSVCRRLYVSGAGFTLVELVVTIVIIGILSSLGGMFISKPIEGYIDLERRTELVDQAEMALRRMQRDIRAALPNSVRTFAGGKGIEFLHVVDGGRYRRAVAGDGSGDDFLDFTKADGSFEVLGGLQNAKSGQWVVVYNLASSGDTANAYYSAPDDNENRKKMNRKELLDYRYDDSVNPAISKISFNAKGFPFPYSSPYQRFFIVDEAVSYIIDPVGHTLKRYSGYTIQENTDPTSVVGSLVAKYVRLPQDAAGNDLDAFTYDSGTNSRGGLVTIRLALEDTDRAPGERITLLHQVHVDNAP